MGDFSADLLQALSSPLGLFLLGLCTGSFLNVVARRLPLMMHRRWWAETAAHLQDGQGLPINAAQAHAELEQRRAVAEQLQARLDALPPLSLSRPRSYCPACGHRLRWHENLPVLGWLLLRGRCSACSTSIGLRYPLVELGTGLIFLGMGLRWNFEPTSLLWSAWAALVLVLALIDWDTTLLPDDLTLALLWTGLVAAGLGWTLPLDQAVWGAVAGYGALWLVATLFERVTGQEGLGRGDVKLLAGLGAWLGPMMLLPVVLLASLVGMVVGLALKARGGLREGRYLPFGPFLAAGGLAVSWAGTFRVLEVLGWR